MNSRALASLLGLLLSFPVVALGQQPPARNLSERAVVAVAVQKNPTLHVALLRASQSRYLVRAEEALFTPIFDANTGVTHTRTPFLSGTEAVRVSTNDTVDIGAGLSKAFPFGTVVSVNVAGQRSLRPASDADALGGVGLAAVGPGYSLLGQLAVTQPLMRGSGSDVGLASLRQARLSLSANELRAQETASALLADVVSAYWELWYAAEVVRINQASQELALLQERQAREQVASGALAPASALPYVTQVAELEEAVLSARAEERERQLILSQLLGHVDASQVGMRASDQPLSPVADPGLEQSAAEKALESSYLRRRLQAELAVTRDQLKVSGDPLRPRLDLEAYVQVQGLGNRRVPPAFEQVGRLEAVSAHVGLSFETPVTDTRRASQVQAATLAAHIAEKQIAEAELSIRKSVASAITRRHAASDRVALAARTEKVAREQAEAERARFLAGSSIAISVQQAEDSLRQAQLRAQRARVELVLAELDLAELSGQLLSRYSAALNDLSQETRFTLISAAAVRGEH